MRLTKKSCPTKPVIIFFQIEKREHKQRLAISHNFQITAGQRSGR